MAHTRAKKHKARDEDALSDLVSELCVGTPEGSSAYPKYPGNPPLWGERYTVSKASGRWKMTRLPKGAPKEEKGGVVENGGGVDYNKCAPRPHSWLWLVGRSVGRLIG